jgi:polynucleotide 5'-hydroxyl-kinase GRC3/NOL9
MVKGPANVIVKGPCHILGSNVSGQTIRVRAGKALPFEPGDRCRLKAQLGYGASIWWANSDEAGTSMWRRLIPQVLSASSDSKKSTVMLVGDTDTGKSTLTIYLANMAIRRGQFPAIIDGDIGQGDLAPPAAIGAAILSKQVTDLRDVDSSMFEFIGSISPVGLEKFIATKLSSMLERMSQVTSIILVNTDGYVRNGGVDYKAMIAQELKPNVIISLDKDDMLFDALKTGPWRILRASPSSQTYKSKFERLSRRLDQLLRYVGNKSYTADMSRLRFVYLGRFFSASELLLHPSPDLLRPEDMKDMFVGLGSNGKVKGFGIIMNVSLARSILNLQTDVNSFDTVYVSNVRVNSYTATDI